MRIERVCNGWIIYEDGMNNGPFVSPVLGVFNHLEEMTSFIKNYYLKLDQREE